MHSINKKIVYVLLTCLLLTTFTPFLVYAQTTLPLTDGFETGINTNVWSVHTNAGGTATINTNTLYCHSGSKSMYFGVTSTSNSYAELTTTVANSIQSVNVTEWFYYAGGGIALLNADGTKFVSIMGSYGGVNGLLYNLGPSPAYPYFALRYYNFSSASWEDVSSGIQCSPYTWYDVSLCYSNLGSSGTNTTTLLVNDEIACSIQGTPLQGIENVSIGNLYGGGNSADEFIDDVSITSGGASTNFNEVLSDDSAHLIYPSVSYDNYFWTTSCRPDNTLRKYDLSLNLINSVTIDCLDHSADECFNAYVFDGLVYVPMIGYQANNYVLEIFNEATLAKTGSVSLAGTTCNALTTAVYSPVGNCIIFGADMQNGKYEFAKMNVDDPTGSSFTFVDIGHSVAVGSSCEVTPISFDGKVYCVGMDNGAGYAGVVHTTVWSSSDYSTWNVEFTASGYNTATGAYFPHISASDQYIMVGYISGNQGSTTYIIVYKSKNSVWTGFDTHYTETSGEDHVMVDAIGSSLFLVEMSQRQNINSPIFYLVDASTGSHQFFSIIPDLGYNDRWFGIDTTFNQIYVADNEYTKAQTSSRIIVFPMNFQLHDYTAYSPQGLNPSPSPLPSQTPPIVITNYIPSWILAVLIYVGSVVGVMFGFYKLKNKSAALAIAVGLIVATVLCDVLAVLGAYVYPINALMVLSVVVALFLGRSK